MANTTAQDVIDSFESSFQNKTEIADTLEIMWLKKAIGTYSIEINSLVFNSDTNSFDSELDEYCIDTLAEIMKRLYLERECSRVNKIASVVGKDISINSGMSLSKYSENELLEVKSNVDKMLSNVKSTAYN